MKSRTSAYDRLAVLLSLAALHAPVVAGAAELEHPLFRAVESRNDALVAQLLRQSAPVDLQLADGTTPLMVAALHGSVESVRQLLEYGADVNAANDRGVTPLIWAATEPEKARLLVNQGADVNARSARWNTPLHVAAASPGAAVVVQLLLDHGGDAAARNRDEASVLGRAVGAGSLESVQALIAHAEATNSLAKLVGDDARRLLEFAGDVGNLEIATLLCDRLTALNGGELPEAGQALNSALLSRNVAVAMELIERGARVDVLDRPHDVPTLLLAAYTETDDPLVLKTLLDRGVDVNAVNDEGESALTWARRRGHPELIDVLRKSGAPDPGDPSPELPQRNVNLHAGVEQSMLRETASRSIALLQHSSDEFFEHRKCVSCHHHNLPAVALGWARDRGVPINEASIDRMLQRHAEDRTGAGFINRCYQLANPSPVPPRLLGYRLWGDAALGLPPSPESEAAVWYFAAMQHPDGHWRSGSVRPPMGDGDVLATALVLQALQLYPIAGRESELQERISRAALWLAEYRPRYHQERVFQLLGLGWAGQSPENLGEFTERLLADQRDDGGWSQLPHLASDAWATGETLVALHIAGGLPTTSPAYRSGLQFLLNTQFEDGSWFVKSRSNPFQPHFESGFPYGRDQWISAGATAWAVMAMTLAIEPREVRLPREIGGETPSSEPNVTDSKEPTNPTEEASLNPSPIGDVDFARDVRPILERSCVGCHSGDEPSSNLVMTNRDSLLKGGDSGVAALSPGLSDESLLLTAAIGSADGLTMPPEDDREKFPALETDELAILKKWIDDGAAWPKGVELKSPAY